MSRTLELTDFTSTPVDINTFIEDSQYLGELFAGNVYPYWIEKLQEVYPNGPISPYVEVYLDKNADRKIPPRDASQGGTL